MIITATEFKQNMGKYLDLVHQEDITITKNGKKVGVLVNPATHTLQQLRGIIKLPEEKMGIDRKDIKEMRVREKYEDND